MILGIIGFCLQVLALVISNIINNPTPYVSVYIVFLVMTFVCLGLSIVGLIISISKLKQNEKKALSIVNLVFSILGIILSLIVVIVNAILLASLINA